MEPDHLSYELIDADLGWNDSGRGEEMKLRKKSLTALWASLGHLHPLLALGIEPHLWLPEGETLARPQHLAHLKHLIVPEWAVGHDNPVVEFIQGPTAQQSYCCC